MKNFSLMVGILVGLFLVGNCWALDPIHHTIEFDTSSGTTKLQDVITFNSRTQRIFVGSTGDDVYATFDGTTTPVKNKHMPLWETSGYMFSYPQGYKIEFTGGGVTDGWLNVIEFSN